MKKLKNTSRKAARLILRAAYAQGNGKTKMAMKRKSQRFEPMCCNCCEI
jgi:hypothetical protein